jgi:hypothetical protein
VKEEAHDARRTGLILLQTDPSRLWLQSIVEDLVYIRALKIGNNAMPIGYSHISDTAQEQTLR